jgi:hypothetical protein
VAVVTGAVAVMAGVEVEVVAAGAVAAVVAELTGAVAVVAGAAVAVVDVTADCGEVAACACRENSSKMVRIPAAKIATCTARRAM